MKNQKNEAGGIFNHIKEECIKDPLFVTKMIVSVFGANILTLVLRIAGYMAVFYVMTTYLGVSNGVAGLTVLVVILSYNSLMIIYNKIKEGAGRVKSN
jgi:hypothetical protein